MFSARVHPFCPSCAILIGLLGIVGCPRPPKDPVVTVKKAAKPTVRCTDGRLFRNSVGFIVRAEIDGQRIRSNDPKFTYMSAINRVGQSLRKEGYELSAAASRLQIPQSGNMVYFPEWEGAPLPARDLFADAAAQMLSGGGLDYLVFGEVRLYGIERDRMSGRYVAGATVNLDLLNVDTEENLGVVATDIRGSGVDVTQALKSAMVRALEASVPLVTKMAPPPPSNCPRLRKYLVWYSGYRSERRQVRPLRKQLDRLGVQPVRCRSQVDLDREQVYDQVCAVRFDGEVLDLYERIETAIQSAGMKPQIDDIETSGSSIQVRFGEGAAP